MMMSGLSKPALVLLVLASLALTACGKRGALDRPPPLWGGKGGPEPVASPRDRPATPETINSSIRNSPVETGKADPLGSPGDFFPR